MPAGDGEHLVHGIDDTEAGSPRCRDNRPDPARGEQVIKCREIQPARGVDPHRNSFDAEHSAHAAVGVMRFLAVGNAAARMQLAGDVKGFQVRDRAAGRQVTQVRGEAEHPGQLRHDLLFHPGGGRAAVECVVIGVDEHRREVADDGGWMRRLEHLPRVGRMEERIVFSEPLGKILEDTGDLLVAYPQGRVALERRE